MLEMRERIILAPGVVGTELLGTLAKLGTNTIGTRVMSPEGLAEFALMRSGISMSGEYLTRKDAALVVDTFMKDLGYFENVSFADAETMAQTLFSVRQMIPEKEAETIHEKLTDGEFKEKNKALIKAYDLYMSFLADEGKIDFICKIRKALEEAAPIDADFVILNEFPLNPLEKALTEKLSPRQVEQIRIADLAELTEEQNSNIVITDCYGASNEVRDILGYIYREGIPLDQCIIAVANTSQYSQLFNEICLENKIPVRFGCGVSINTSNPARLLRLYQNWQTKGYHGVDALRSMLKSSAFDRDALKKLLLKDPEKERISWDDLTQVAGYLRLSADAAINEERLKGYQEYLEEKSFRNDDEKESAFFIADCAAALAKELEKGVVYWIRTYSKIRKFDIAAIDKEAQNLICDRVAGYLSTDESRSLDGIIDSVLIQSVYRLSSEEGALFVTDIRGAMSALRKHLFVTGLSSDNFPGTPTENYIMLDSDYLLISDHNAAPTSTNLVRWKKDDLANLLAFAKKAGAVVRLSYSSFDLAALKELNPSSVLFDIYKSINGIQSKYEDFLKATAKAGYFGDQTSRHAALGIAYAEGSKIKIKETDNTTSEGKVSISSNRRYSPSAISDYVECPKKFFLKNVLRIPEPEEDNPSEVIHAYEKGTLLHTLMERNAESRLSEEAFMGAAGVIFESFLKSRPPLSHEIAQIEKERFLELALDAYRQEPEEYEVVLMEKDVETTHPAGITIHGYPDRVERHPDGNCLIVDFKSGRKDRHASKRGEMREETLRKYVQALVYAFIMEAKGVKITDCEFRYPQLGIAESCKYDAGAKAVLQDILLELKGALDSGEFPATPGKDACEYCKYQDICGK